MVPIWRPRRLGWLARLRLVCPDRDSRAFLISGRTEVCMKQPETDRRAAMRGASTSTAGAMRTANRRNRACVRPGPATILSPD